MKLQEVKNIKLFQKKKINRNLDLLPPHIREALNKQLKFHA